MNDNGKGFAFVRDNGQDLSAALEQSIHAANALALHKAHQRVVRARNLVNARRHLGGDQTDYLRALEQFSEMWAQQNGVDE